MAKSKRGGIRRYNLRHSLGGELARGGGYLFGCAFILSLSSPCSPAQQAVAFGAPNGERIEHQTRVAHISEVLGKSGSSKYAFPRNSLFELEPFIYKRVFRALSEKWRPRFMEIAEALIRESNRYGLDPLFVMAIIHQESTFRPDVQGPFGEVGLMQLRPQTAAWIAERLGIRWEGVESLYDPVYNIRLGVGYIGYLRESFDGDSRAYVSAYNMGPGKVRSLLKNNIQPQEYATKVLRHYLAFNAAALAERRAKDVKFANAIEELHPTRM